MEFLRGMPPKEQGDDRQWAVWPEELASALLPARTAHTPSGNVVDGLTIPHGNGAGMLIHAHVIREDWPRDMKDAVAKHIAQYHEPR